MIVKIDKSERDIFEKTCATFVWDVRFYTDEVNPGMLKAEITDMGGELSLTSAYRLGRMIGMERLHNNVF